LDLFKRFKKLVDKQYGKPKGLVGLYIGEKMVQQHQPETLWTINLLSPQHDDTILELGCGAGYAVKQIIDEFHVNQLVGLDISKTVIQSARIRNRKHLSNGKVKFLQGDVKQLPFQDQFFSKVFSIQSIYFWEDLPNTFAEIYRVMKPEGSIIITLSDGENDNKWEGITTLIEHQVMPIMEQCGFKNIEKIKGPDSRDFQTVAIKARV
jgi:ubiquinone/menaquinone biosynthesis C-methylase UbiE